MFSTLILTFRAVVLYLLSLNQVVNLKLHPPKLDTLLQDPLGITVISYSSQNSGLGANSILSNICIETDVCYATRSWHKFPQNTNIHMNQYVFSTHV